jgi:hypothetical protein
MNNFRRYCHCYWGYIFRFWHSYWHWCWHWHPCWHTFWPYWPYWDWDLDWHWWVQYYWYWENKFDHWGLTLIFTLVLPYDTSVDTHSASKEYPETCVLGWAWLDWAVRDHWRKHWREPSRTVVKKCGGCYCNCYWGWLCFGCWHWYLHWCWLDIHVDSHNWPYWTCWDCHWQTLQRLKKFWNILTLIETLNNDCWNSKPKICNWRKLRMLENL